MAKRSSASIGVDFLLQLCLGAFFLAAGILGVTDYNSTASGVLRLFKNDTFNLVVAVVELAMGAILILGLFVSIGGGLGQTLGIILAVLWALWMVMNYLLNNFLEPSFVRWLFNFSRDLVILVALWMVGNRLAGRS